MAKKSKFKVNVGSKAKIIIDWKDNPENYSYESKKHIISIMADRYGLPKESIKVEFTPIKYNDKGEVIDVSTDVINNIQDPKFQIKLFIDYITENNITNIDFEFIKKIDSEINSKIDYDVYDKYRKYEIEWMEWDNFQSYGVGNRFDFQSLNGLTLVNGEPANQSGKSTFTIDLISFLLFGKSQKPYTLSECFNKFTDEKFFRVCGGIKIDGTSYVIERIVTRTKKRTGEWGDASQEVKYYEVVNGIREDLPDGTKNNNDEHAGKTNKIIKEAIGNEKDFNMIVSATGDDLDDLIGIGNSERGRLLSKWIGLYPLEEKDGLAKKEYSSFEKNLKSRIYNETDLNIEIENARNSINENQLLLNSNKLRLESLEELILAEQQNKENLLLSKRQINDEVLKLDITTVNEKLKTLEISGQNKQKELDLNKENYEKLKNVTFDNDEYKKLVSLDKEYSININDIKNEIRNLRATNKSLLENEFCPTCKRKYDGADNSESIKLNDITIENLTKKGIEFNEMLSNNKKLIEKFDEDKINFDKKSKLSNLIEVLPVLIENLRNDYREQRRLLKEYAENKDAIDLNNQIDIKLTMVNAKINSFTIEKNSKVKEIENINRNIVEFNKTIDKNTIIIAEIKEEFKKIKNWKVYLDMVGKNGVSKMVLRKTLPIINSELARMLDDVCDFDVEVVLNEKNEVMFKIIKDGTVSNLAGGSGFELTASALALRCVLGNISTMPRPNFITLDEILGKVAEDNYESIRNMYAKIESSYQFILHISHLKDIKDWHKNIITVSKKDNVSSIVTTINSKNA